MAQKKVTRGLAIGLLGIALYIFTLTTGWFLTIGIIGGMLGSIMIIITQVMFLWRNR